MYKKFTRLENDVMQGDTGFHKAKYLNSWFDDSPREYKSSRNLLLNPGRPRSDDFLRKPLIEWLDDQDSNRSTLEYSDDDMEAELKND